MRTKVLLTAALCLTAAILLYGCGSPANTAVNTAAKNTAAAPVASPATDAKPADTKAADTADPVTSVTECDQYIKKYEACLTKIAKAAPQAETALKQSFDAQRTGFKTAAANPASKATLAATCKQAMDTAKSATKAYGCDW